MLPIRESQRPQLASLASSGYLRDLKNAHKLGVIKNSAHGIYLGPSIRITATATSEKNENSAGATLHFETYAKAQKVTSLSIKRLEKTCQNYLERQHLF